MCPRRAKKLMILSRFEYLVILTLHRYRRTSTTVSSPSVRGATPRRRVPPLRTCHYTTPYEGPMRRSDGIGTPKGPRPA